MTDVKYLEFLCEKLAYVCFLEDKYDYFHMQNIDRDSIENFSVRVFIEQYIEEEETQLDMSMRFSLNIVNKPSITFVYNHEVFMPAILEKVVKLNPDEGCQIHSFNYGKPNPIVLHDAEFLLEEELGVKVDNDLG